MRRRDFLAAGLSTAACLTSVSRAYALTEHSTLDLYHIHTREHLEITYREHGELVPQALEAITYLLRDFRREQSHSIDLELLDTLTTLYDMFDHRGRFEVISGYRSPRTNEALRRVTTGVAKDSLHVEGRAIDVRLTSADTAALRDAALSLHAGGVGYYPKSKFVHLDTGRLRSWDG